MLLLSKKIPTIKNGPINLLFFFKASEHSGFEKEKEPLPVLGYLKELTVKGTPEMPSESLSEDKEATSQSCNSVLLDYS